MIRIQNTNEMLAIDGRLVHAARITITDVDFDYAGEVIDAAFDLAVFYEYYPGDRGDRDHAPEGAEVSVGWIHPLSCSVPEVDKLIRESRAYRQQLAKVLRRFAEDLEESLVEHFIEHAVQ
jgi:hypothetical protein